MGTLALSLPPVDEPVWQQTHQAMMARTYAEENLPLQSPQVLWMNHPHIITEVPFYAWLVSWLYWLLGEQEWLGRAVSLLSFGAVLIFVFRIVRTIADSRVAMVTLCLFAVSPAMLASSRAWLPDMLTLALALGYLACLFSDEKQQPWLLPAVVLLLLASASLPGLILWGVLILMFSPSAKTGWTRFILATLILACSITGILAWMNRIAGNAPEVVLSEWLSQTSTVSTQLLAAPLVFLAGLASDGFAWWMLAAVAAGIPIVFSIPRWRWPLVLMLLAGAVLTLLYPGDWYRTASARLLLYTPALIVAGLGLGWIMSRLRIPLWLMMVFVLGASAWSVQLLHDRGVYTQRYPYYQEAVNLRETLPEEGYIIVRDELPRLPEFFYFVNRRGYAIQRDPHDFVDDSAWIEEKRAEGAIAFIGLTESFDNNPIRYLQGHLTGTWLWSNYELVEMGYRHFVVRLDQPRDGHANPDGIQFDLHDPLVDRESLAQHLAADDSSGFEAVSVGSGRLAFRPSERVLPVTNVVHAIGMDHTPQSANGIPIGVLDAGRYRISIEPAAPITEPFTLRISTPDAYAIAARSYQAPHLTVLAAGARPEVFVFINQPTPVFLHAEQPGEPMAIRSWACVPDVECLPVDMQFEAESLFTRSARVVDDPNASGGKTLWGYTREEGTFFAHGGFFRFPDGVYAADFRVREPRGWSQGDLQVGLYENALIWQAVQNFGTPWMGSEYMTIGVEARVQEMFNLETRAFIHPNTEVMLDTITIRQRRRDSWSWQATPVVDSVIWNDEHHEIRASGLLINSTTRPVHKQWGLSALVAGADSHQQELRLVDHAGTIHSPNYTTVWQFTIPDGEQIAYYNWNHNTDTHIAVLESGSILLHSQNVTIPLDSALAPNRIRDLHTVSSSELYVLYENGHVIPVGTNATVTSHPDFGFDAARSLVPWNDSLYVIDCTGAIHPLNDAPPILSPHYRVEDWILGAWVASPAQWNYLTADGDVLPIHFGG